MTSFTVSKYVSVEVDLSDFSDETLLKELRERHRRRGMAAPSPAYKIDIGSDLKEIHAELYRHRYGHAIASLENLLRSLEEIDL